MVSVENVVASGSLGVELDLEAVARELSEVVDYDRKNIRVPISASMTLHR